MFLHFCRNKHLEGLSIRDSSIRSGEESCNRGTERRVDGMCMRGDSLLKPLRVSFVKPSSKRIDQWVVAPKEIKRTCALRVRESPFSGINRSEELICAMVIGIDVDHGFKCGP